MPGWRERLQSLWFRPSFAISLLPLLPFEAVFVLLSSLRRLAYRSGLLASVRIGRPLIVVGNISVGGTGKTPLVIWLTEALRAAGRHPGVIARGCGGSGATLAVAAGSDPGEVGDEPLLIARRGTAPVVVGRDRVAAARALLAAHPEVDTIVADDGLQHYRLHRDVELVVVDARGFGNRHRLPVGPLRESPARLASVDAVVINGEGGAPKSGGCRSFAMRLEPGELRAVDGSERRCRVADLAKRPLCALAGIGDPARFFSSLRQLGLDFESRAFPDHHRYIAADLAFASGRVLLMTEKDAVKCRDLAGGEAWYLPVDARIEPDLLGFVLEKLNGCKTA